jgi:hypothetical protein
MRGTGGEIGTTQWGTCRETMWGLSGTFPGVLPPKGFATDNFSLFRPEISFIWTITRPRRADFIKQNAKREILKLLIKNAKIFFVFLKGIFFSSRNLT